MSFTHGVISSMSAYTPYLCGRPHSWPQETTPVRYHSPRSLQDSGPPLSYWHASTPPSSKPAQSALRWIVPPKDDSWLHTDSETMRTFASLNILGFGPPKRVCPHPVTKHSFPSRNLIPSGRRHIGYTNLSSFAGRARRNTAAKRNHQHMKDF